MNIFYDIINIIPLSLLMTMFFSRYTGMPQDSIIGYSVNCGVCLLIIILRHISRKNRFRLIGVTAVFAAGLLLAAGETFRQLLITDYGWLGWNTCISVAAAAAGILTENNVWARRCAAAGLFILSIVGIVCKWDIGKTAFTLILFLLCIYITAEIQSKWKKKGYPDIKEHVARISPVLLALCITVHLIPAPDTPYDWQFVKDIYTNASVYINKLINFISHPYEEYADIGFSDTSGFYDNIRSKDREVLVVTSSNSRIGNLRLIGCVSGEFNGEGWIFDTENESTDRMMDTLETLCAVNKYDEENRFDYFKKTDIRYENQLPNTKFMFAPAKLKLETSMKNNPTYNDRNNSIITKRRMNTGDEYFLSHYTLNSDDPKFIDMLNTAQPVTESDWLNTVNNSSIDKSIYSFNSYQEYHSRIYDKYAVSEGVSEEVGKILEEIRGNSQNRYELMKNLEAHLCKMEYSRSDGALPSSVNDSSSYLDYFLLASQKGYCIHYATAFVLMARELGVPCRYVQGYYAKSDPSYKIVVNESQAHAWPEVYFDNAGWISFEPTPGYSNGGSWITSDRQNASFSYEEEEYYEDDISDTESDVSDDEDEKSGRFDARIFIIPVLSVIGFLLLLYLYSRIYSKIKYSRMDDDEKFRYLTRENLRYLKHIGYKIRTGETLAEYSQRLCGITEYDFKNYVAFISHYEKILYSDDCINPQHIEDVETTYNFLRNIIFKGKLRYRIKMLLYR